MRRGVSVCGVLALALSTVGCRHAGAGYHYEQLNVTAKATEYDSINGTYNETRLVTSYARHRIRVIDLTGIAFALFRSASSVRLEDPNCPTGTQGCVPRPVVDRGNGTFDATYRVKVYPVVRGIRATFDYAWAGGTRSASVDGGADMDVELSYSEYRLAFGIADAVGRYYYDLSLLDFAKRNLRIEEIGGTWMANPFQWRIGAETGVALSGSMRAGVFLDYDMVSGIDFLFEGSPQGYNTGVAMAMVNRNIHLEGRLQREQLASQDGTATGHGFVLSGLFTY